MIYYSTGSSIILYFKSLFSNLTELSLQTPVQEARSHMNHSKNNLHHLLEDYWYKPSNNITVCPKNSFYKLRKMSI